MSIVTYLSTGRHVRGTDIKVGQPVYAIQKGELFFVWSYSDLAMAEYMDVKLTGPESLVDEQANWRRSTVLCTPTDTRLKR